MLQKFSDQVFRSARHQHVRAVVILIRRPVTETRLGSHLPMDEPVALSCWTEPPRSFRS